MSLSGVKNMKKTTYLIVLTAALAALAGVAGTLAWLTDTDTAANVVTTGNVKIAIYENEKKITKNTADRFDGACLPGQKLDKRVKVANEGKNNAYVRISVQNEGGLTLSELGAQWAEYHGYYYYTTVLDAGTNTSELITYVMIPEDWAGANEGKELKVVINAQAIQSDNQDVVDVLHPTLEELETIFGSAMIQPAEPDGETETDPGSEPNPDETTKPDETTEPGQKVMEWLQEQLNTSGSTVQTILTRVTESLDSTGPNYAKEIEKALQEAGIEEPETDYSWQIRREADGSGTIYWVDGSNINDNEAGDIVSALRYNTKIGVVEGSRDMIIYSKIVLDSKNVPQVVNYLVPYEPELGDQTGILWLAKNMVANSTLNQYFGATGARTMDSSGVNFGKPVSSALTAETGLSSDSFLWKIERPATDKSCNFYWADVNPEECQTGAWVTAVRYNGYTGELTEGQCQIAADGNGKKLGAFQAD